MQTKWFEQTRTEGCKEWQRDDSTTTANNNWGNVLERHKTTETETTTAHPLEPTSVPRANYDLFDVIIGFINQGDPHDNHVAKC